MFFRIICHDETPQFVNYNMTDNRRGLAFGVREENYEVLAKSTRDCVTVQPFSTLAGAMSMCQVIFSKADKCVYEGKRKCAAAGLKMCEVCSNVLPTTCGKAACKIDGKRPMMILPACN